MPSAVSIVFMRTLAGVDHGFEVGFPWPSRFRHDVACCPQGLNLPEVSLVCILDADAEGFLRSDTALLQTIGRATRHEAGRVVLYADRVTPSMKRALAETDRRRDIQLR